MIARFLVCGALLGLLASASDQALAAVNCGTLDAPVGTASLIVIKPYNGTCRGTIVDGDWALVVTNKSKDAEDQISVVFVVHGPSGRVQIDGFGCVIGQGYKHPAVELSDNMQSMTCHATYITSNGITLDADISLNGAGRPLKASNIVLRGGKFGN